MNSKKDISKAIEPPVEILPDAWERFERAVDVVVRSPPQHKTHKAKARAPGQSTSSKDKGGG